MCVRMSFHIETLWVLEEYFQKQCIHLRGRHLLKSRDLLLSSVESKHVVPDLEPVFVGLLTEACVFLLQLVDDSEFISLHSFF